MLLTMSNFTLIRSHGSFRKNIGTLKPKTNNTMQEEAKSSQEQIGNDQFILPIAH